MSKKDGPNFCGLLRISWLYILELVSSYKNFHEVIRNSWIFTLCNSFIFRFLENSAKNPIEFLDVIGILQWITNAVALTHGAVTFGSYQIYV